MKTKHIPVLLNELISSLKIKTAEKKVVVDATLGGGGHAKKVLEIIQEGGKLIAIDIDKDAIDRFQNYIDENGFENNVNLFLDNFRNIRSVVDRSDSKRVDAIYADLGFSTDQLNQDLTFQKEGELDLRMDKTLQIKAKDLINGLYEKELVKLFETYSDEKLAKPIAKEITRHRKENGMIERKEELVSIIREVVAKFNINSKSRNANPEARIFQALRMAVNDEINALEQFLNDGFEVLNKDGTLAVISFHSGEDRIVKKFMKEKIKNDEAVWVEELVIPGEEEIRKNRKSRSSKLRAIKKIK